MTGKNVLRVVVGITIVACLLLVMFSYQVRQNELAMVETLGTLAETPAGPGLHFRLPWPIQRVTKYDHSIQHFESNYSQLQTKDKQAILLGVYVCWRIDDPRVYRKAIAGDLHKGRQALNTLTEGIVGAVVSGTPMDAMASLEPGAVKLEQMEQSIFSQLEPTAKAEYGVQIMRVGVKRSSLPQSVSENVMTNITSQRQGEARNALANGAAAADAIESESEALAEQVLSFARARAQEIKARGQASAASYYKRYGEEEAFAMFLRRLEYLKNTMKVNSMFILDGSQYDVSHGWFGAPPSASSVETDADQALTPSK